MARRSGWVPTIIMVSTGMMAGMAGCVSLVPARATAPDAPAEQFGGMALIPGGHFRMGGTLYTDEQPIHSVHLDAYYMDEHEVTFAQYDAFCDATGRIKPDDAGWGRGARPVINITWSDARMYCAWAGKRLPTEAEWEKACRAGTDTVYYWGDDSRPAASHAWYWDNCGGMTQPVGRKLPNAFGLHDMSGNVWEWVADWYDPGYYAIGPEKDPPGPSYAARRRAGRSMYRVVRGGSWHGYRGYVGNLRSAVRNPIDPGYRDDDIGCRCVKNP